MGNSARVLVSLSLLLFITSCERWSWPPYERSARALFEENKELFEAIRQNMESDDLEFMSDAYARGRNRVRAGQEPAILSAELQAKYSALVDERSAFQFELTEDHFIVDVSSPSLRDYYLNFSYVRGVIDRSIPRCSEASVKDAACGSCSVPMNADWTMFWSWFPKRGEDEDESCRFVEDAA
jgi:hypothetical protein